MSSPRDENRSLAMRLYTLREELRASWRALGAKIHPDPVFVLGTQKSGTSAIASLLAIAAELEASIDLRRDLDRPRAAEVATGRRAFGGFLRRNAVDFSRPIVKEPNLTFLLPEILGRWPQARIVFVDRDPVQTVRSVLDRLEIPGDLEGLEHLDAATAASIPAGWRIVLDSRWCERHAPGGEVGRPRRHYVEELARRSLLSRRIAEACAHARPDRTHVVSYEAFRQDKAGTIERLLGALGLPMRVERGEFSQHLDRPFQPPGRFATATPESFFGANLERLRQAAGLAGEVES